MNHMHKQLNTNKMQCDGLTEKHKMVFFIIKRIKWQLKN